MSTSVREILFGGIVSVVFAFSNTAALAQTGIDEVDITPRAKLVDVASAAYGSGSPARFATASLIRTSVNLVLVPVTITDDQNHPVIGLNQDNFQIFEDKKPQEIKHFSSEDSPVSIGILVDTSGSMSYKLDEAREAVAQFCDAANPQDEFFLITFADEARVATDFTTRTQDITNELLTVSSRGQTALLDAIYMGIQKMRGARYARRALLILSDGGDNHSRYTEHDVKAAIKEADETIYSIGIFDHYVNTQEESLGPELLRSIAEKTGGTAFTLSRLGEMPALTRIIGVQLRHQYMLAYQPQSAPLDGKWHKLNVKLRLPKAFHNYFFHVGARPGYYAGGE